MKNKDEQLLSSFKSFLQKRENILSNGIDIESTNHLYNQFIIPLLEKGEYSLSVSKNDMEKFAGEIFALSMYAKYHLVNSWKHEPNVEDKTPDFEIDNGDYYIEIYSPAINHKNSNLNYYLNTDRNQLRYKIEKKSKQYDLLNLKIIVSVVVTDFTNDLMKSLEKASLVTNKHSLILYHGDREYIIQ